MPVATDVLVAGALLPTVRATTFHVYSAYILRIPKVSSERTMLSKFTEKDIKDFIRKVDELISRQETSYTLDDYLLLEVFLSENRVGLNRRDSNSARKVAEQVMARWRKEKDLKAGLERGNALD